MRKIIDTIKAKLAEREIGRMIAECDEILEGPNHRPDTELDALYSNAVNIVLQTGQASAAILERKLKVSFENAWDLLGRMEQEGIVGPFDGKNPRKILVETQQRTKSTGIAAVDLMGGHEFERFIADLLQRTGYQNVRVTKGSGDQGVDILAEKDSIRYAIQCKNYSSPLGNTPVQEVAAGRDYYGCHVGVVVTNNYFTAGGKELANRVRVLLWDRDTLEKMIIAAGL